MMLLAAVFVVCAACTLTVTVTVAVTMVVLGLDAFLELVLVAEDASTLELPELFVYMLG